MKAATQHRYGSPNVLALTEVATPAVGDHDVLITVHASTVTQGDRRLRAADYPGIAWLAGRMMTGLFRPRHRVPGTMFAGRVAAVGKHVTDFAPGEDVFGSCMHGAHAERLAVPHDGALAPMPSNLSYEEAAAVPYGAVTALVFLRDLAKVRPGERVLIIGGSGGVGRFAVQIARHQGAEVTAVCGRHHRAVAMLGAHHVVDYRTEDFTQHEERYDVIVDTSGSYGYSDCASSLTASGRYLSLYMSIPLLLRGLWTRITGGRRAMFGIAMGDRDLMVDVRNLVEAGAVRPTIDRGYALEHIDQAHTRIETHHPLGSVVVHVTEPCVAAP